MCRNPPDHYRTRPEDGSTERSNADSEKERALNHQHGVPVEQDVTKEHKPTATTAESNENRSAVIGGLPRNI